MLEVRNRTILTEQALGDAVMAFVGLVDCEMTALASSKATEALHSPERSSNKKIRSILSSVQAGATEIWKEGQRVWHSLVRRGALLVMCICVTLGILAIPSTVVLKMLGTFKPPVPPAKRSRKRLSEIRRAVTGISQGSPTGQNSKRLTHYAILPCSHREQKHIQFIAV